MNKETDTLISTFITKVKGYVAFKQNQLLNSNELKVELRNTLALFGWEAKYFHGNFISYLYSESSEENWYLHQQDQIPEVLHEGTKPRSDVTIYSNEQKKDLPLIVVEFGGQFLQQGDDLIVKPKTDIPRWNYLAKKGVPVLSVMFVVKLGQKYKRMIVSYKENGVPQSWSDVKEEWEKSEILKDKIKLNVTDCGKLDVGKGWEVYIAVCSEQS